MDNKLFFSAVGASVGNKGTFKVARATDAGDEIRYDVVSQFFGTWRPWQTVGIAKGSRETIEERIQRFFSEAYEQSSEHRYERLRA